MLVCVAPQTAKPAALVLVGRKPPWNQPDVMLLEFSRSPTLRPWSAARLFVLTWLPSEQSSNAGSGSPNTVPTPWALGEPTVFGSLTCAPVSEFTAMASSVEPETRFSAPGVDGPNWVSSELSLIA